MELLPTDALSLRGQTQRTLTSHLVLAKRRRLPRVCQEKFHASFWLLKKEVLLSGY